MCPQWESSAFQCSMPIQKFNTWKCSIYYFTVTSPEAGDKCGSCVKLGGSLENRFILCKGGKNQWRAFCMCKFSAAAREGLPLPSKGCLGKVMLPSLLFTTVSKIQSLWSKWLLVIPVALHVGDPPKSAGGVLACGASVSHGLLLQCPIASLRCLDVPALEVLQARPGGVLGSLI